MGLFISHKNEAQIGIGNINLWNLNPNFKEGTFIFSENSSLKRKGTDGLDLGVIAKK
jgi:hypothetical protein